MATLLEYARIAQDVYRPWKDRGDEVLPWVCPRGKSIDDSSVLDGGSFFSTGFQGRVFKRANAGEVIYAFKGTVPRMASDLRADLALTLNQIPQQAYVALNAVQTWRRDYKGMKESLVGHSLGGALAQVVGFWLGIRFVTFNAPGMLEQTHGLSMPGTGRLVRLFGGGHLDAGVNYRRAWDLVGNFGAPIGRRVVISTGATGVVRGHGIAGFIGEIQRHADANKDPLRN
jgi:hypothetical protein